MSSGASLSLAVVAILINAAHGIGWARFESAVVTPLTFVVIVLAAQLHAKDAAP